MSGFVHRPHLRQLAQEFEHVGFRLLGAHLKLGHDGVADGPGAPLAVDQRGLPAKRLGLGRVISRTPLRRASAMMEA